LAFKDDKSAGREKFLTKIKHLFEKLSNHVSVDGGVDQAEKTTQILEKASQLILIFIQ